MNQQAVCMIFCYVWALLNFAYGENDQTVVIRHRDSSKHYTMGNVLSQLTVTSALDCAQSCASRDDCQGSMLQGNLCVLYKKARCLPLLETTISLDADLPSRYQIASFGEPKGRQEAMRMCKQQNMELAAINNQLEQDKIAELARDYSKFTECYDLFLHVRDLLSLY